MVGFLMLTFWLLRSRTGSAAQADRDDEDAARSRRHRYHGGPSRSSMSSPRSARTRRGGMAGKRHHLLPRTNFGVQWTVFMLFMVLG